MSKESSSCFTWTSSRDGRDFSGNAPFRAREKEPEGQPAILQVGPDKKHNVAASDTKKT